MISKVSQRILRQVRISRNFSTVPTVVGANDIVKSDKLQFSKQNLTDFGELPQGTVPEALKYDRPAKVIQTANGVKVATEKYSGSIASVTVLINAGSRQECIESSGVSNFISKLNFKGTSGRSQSQIESEIGALGGNIQVNVGRESTTYTISCNNDQVTSAVDLLGDIICNSTYNANQIEAEREGILADHLNNTADQHKFIIEAVHYTHYRDHILGAPAAGIRENVSNITEEHIKNYVANNVVGSNITVAVSGNVDNSAISASVDKAFGSLQASAAIAERSGSEQPYHTPSYMLMRDDELANVNVGVFFEAPSYSDPDYFAIQLLTKIIGDYRQDKFTGWHLNTPDRQYNTMHTELAAFPDITLQKCSYIPYSDTGLFGSYLHGNELWANQMLLGSQYVTSEMASYLQPAELYRARNTYYNELLDSTASAETSLEIANQVAYIGRRVPRSEVAQRLSHFDTGLMNRVVQRWFWDKEMSLVAWGATHHLMAFSHYNRPIRRSSLGWLGNFHYRIM